MCSSDLPAIQQDVAVGLLDPLCLGLTEHGDQVGDVGMHIAVGQQSHEVQGLVLSIGDQFLPCLALIEGACHDGYVEQYSINLYRSPTFYFK